MQTQHHSDQEKKWIQEANHHAALKLLEQIEKEEKEAGVYVEDRSAVIIPSKKNLYFRKKDEKSTCR